LNQKSKYETERIDYMKATHKSHFETPTALSHDANTLVEDARGLLEATSEIADERIAAARQRLADALDAGRETYEQLQDKVVQGAKVADRAVRTHPYQSIALAFGIGALAGIVFSRRND
jgi:ElaB/YqjD/DUF883 family membrane-anchored ribosome-binding protein